MGLRIATFTRMIAGSIANCGVANSFIDRRSISFQAFQGTSFLQGYGKATSWDKPPAASSWDQQPAASASQSSWSQPGSLQRNRFDRNIY